MKALVCSPRYDLHMTSENTELRDGLVRAGWSVFHEPSDAIVDGATRLFFLDPRDWRIDTKRNYARGIEDAKVLRSFTGPKALVCKDAWNDTAWQSAFADAMGAGTLVHYYDRGGIVARCPWTSAYRFVRTWHSVDAGLCRAAFAANEAGRGRAILTGHLGPEFYPLRTAVAGMAREWGIRVRRHPTYRNDRGSDTPAYLREIAAYKVHVATASICGVALRKIAESVAVGCVPVTDLPASEVMPGIDGALRRVPPGAPLADVKAAIDDAERTWDRDERLAWAAKAWEWYDWRAVGARLDAALCETT